ncbi:hypothetical protein BASA_1529, partial [Bifidobacterium animalis subsp. animalis]
MALSLSQAPLRSSALAPAPLRHISSVVVSFMVGGVAGRSLGEAWRLSSFCRVVCIACVIGVVCGVGFVSFYVWGKVGWGVFPVVVSFLCVCGLVGVF